MPQLNLLTDKHTPESINLDYVTDVNSNPMTGTLTIIVRNGRGKCLQSRSFTLSGEQIDHLPEIAMEVMAAYLWGHDAGSPIRAGHLRVGRAKGTVAAQGKRWHDSPL